MSSNVNALGGAMYPICMEMSERGVSVVSLAETLLDAARRAGILSRIDLTPKKPQDIARELGLRERPVRALCQLLAEIGYLSGDAEFGFSADPMGPFLSEGQASIVHGIGSMGLLTAEHIADGLRRPLGPGPEWVLGADPLARAATLALTRFPKMRAVLTVGDHQDRFARPLVSAGVCVTAIGDAREIEVEALPRTSGGTLPRSGGAVPQGYDLVALLGVVHRYGWQDNSMLFYKASRCLSRRGGLVVVDWVRGHGLDASLLGLYLCLQGEAGDCYGEADYRMWMKSAGFAGITFDDLGAGSLKLILAQKAGRG